VLANASPSSSTLPRKAFSAFLFIAPSSIVFFSTVLISPASLRFDLLSYISNPEIIKIAMEA
jgi:hypothetical protein